MTDDDCSRTITWAGGTHRFNLNHRWVRNVVAFSGIAGVTPAVALQMFDQQSYSIDQIERIMELGLIGGGMAECEVEVVMDQHVRNRPIAPLAMIAVEVLAALFVGAANVSA